MAFSTPSWVVLGLPSPSPRVCTGGRVGGRTLTSQPKLLGSIGYQIYLAMVLCWWALPAGSTIITNIFTNLVTFPKIYQGKFSGVNDMSMMIDVSTATNYSGVCFDYFLSFFGFFRFFPLFVYFFVLVLSVS